MLLDSKTSGQTPRSLRICILICGLLLLGSYLHGTLREGKPLRETFPEPLLGAVCFYAAGFRKKIYFAPEGIVRETRSWLTRNEEILPWNEIKHVTLAFGKNDMLAFFEKGTMGWRVLCHRRDEDALRKIMKERLPDSEVSVMGQ